MAPPPLLGGFVVVVLVVAVTSEVTSSSEGPVDRCFTVVRAMNTDTTGDDRVDPADPMDASVDVQDTSTSDPGMSRQEPRPDQSASRDRAQSGWDVLPFVPKCGMPCLTCGAPCNRTLRRHFIRLADDNPPHLCFHHDLHELYGEYNWTVRGEFFPPGDCSGKLYECLAAFC